MDWNASVGLILTAAFGIGALHALEPGHGKSIMGAYLIASRGGIRHAFLLGLMVTLTHTFVIFLLAVGALLLADRFASREIMFWLEVVSGVIVTSVGVWMILNAFGLRRGRAGHVHGALPGPVGASHAHPHPHEHPHAHPHPHEHPHPHPHEPALAHAHPHPHSHEHHAHEPGHPHPHDHAHPHAHDHGDGHDHEHDDDDDARHFALHGHTHSVKIPEGKNPLGLWALIAVGASGGLVPCPAALTALLAAINLGRPVTGIAVVGAMSLGIATTLIAIGIFFVQAGKVASRMFGGRALMVHVPRVSAVLITGLGIALVIRSFLGHH